MFLITAPPESAGSRLDRFLAERLAEFPARSVAAAIAAGDVLVGGGRAPKGLRLCGGETIRVLRIAEAADWLPLPDDLPGATVLFEDGTVAVLDKPAGCHTEPQRPREAGTLAGFLRMRYPHVEGVSALPGLTLLTRLDRETSGAVLAALTADAFLFLLAEREAGRLAKSYACIVVGRLDRSLTISCRLETRGGAAVRARSDVPDPDPLSWTIVEPVRELSGYTLARASICRGKRHQVRAHLAAAGFPIAGDRLYGDGGAERGGIERLWLHAASVRFSHPATGKTVTVESPLPPGFGAT